MTDKQSKALRLANALEAAWSGTLHPTREAAAAELRRLHAINAQMLEALEAASNYVDNLGGVSQRYRQVIAAAKEQA